MNHEIVQQIQPCGISCVSTCIAMIIGRLAEEVKSEYHDNYMSGHVTIPTYMSRFGFHAEPMLTTDWSEKEGGLYLIMAPSMNMDRATHEIVADWRDPEGGIILYDPNNGKPGKRYYVCKHKEDLLENEFNLLGFSYDFRITKLEEA